MFSKILAFFLLVFATFVVILPVHAGKWDRGWKILSEEFNTAAKKPREADPPPTTSYEYRPPNFPEDAEKITIKDADVIRNTLPERLPSKPDGPKP